MTEEHGGNVYGNDVLYDFSANLTPLGMPLSVKQAIITGADSFEKYPDPFCRELREKLSILHDVPFENIVCGNGAADLIYRVIGEFAPKKAVLTAPAFSEYEKALTEAGCREIYFHILSEDNDFIVDESILESLDDDTDMLILCSPNNPTGQTIPLLLLEKICSVCLEKNILFLCDECFMDFTGFGRSRSAFSFINKNVIVLKAFTKIYALAGIRLGYAVFGDREAAYRVSRRGQYWSVSSPAQTAGLAALQEKNLIDETVSLIIRERKYLTDNLRSCGMRVFHSDANFILFFTDKEIAEYLSGEKILIRSCDNYRGLGKGFYRVAVRSHDENKVLITALRRCLDAK